MANFILPKDKKYLLKPPVGSTINWGNPLAQKLVACWLMNEGGGGIIKDIAGRHDGRFSGGSAPLWKPSSKGRILNFDNVDDDIPTTPESSFGCEAGPLTIAALINPNAQPLGDADNYGRILGKGGTGFVAFQYQDNTPGLSDLLIFQKDYATEDLAQISADNTITKNVWTYALVTWDGRATAANVHIYINGKETTYQTTTNGVGTKSSDAAQIWHIGNNTTPGIRDFPGGIGYIMLWKRVFTPSEARFHSSNPYCFIKPYKKVIYFVPVTGAIDVIVTPNVLIAKVVPQAPTIRTNVIISVNTLSSRIVQQALTTRADVIISPTVITNRIIVQSPTIRIDAIVSAGVITSKVTLLSPSIKINALISASTLSNRILGLSPSVRINALISTGVLSSRIIAQSPSVRADTALALSVLQERLLLYAPTIAISAAVTGIADVIRLASQIEQIITRQSLMSQTIVKRSKMEKIITGLSEMDKTITKKSRIEQVIDLDSPLH